MRTLIFKNNMTENEKQQALENEVEAYIRELQYKKNSAKLESGDAIIF